MITTRTAWFPLRSNVAFFEPDRPTLDLEKRIKQMALLADTLMFEQGVLDITLADQGRGGITEFWTPPNMTSEAEIRRKRELAREGQPFQLVIAPQPGPGLPADRLRPAH